ncbi:hypothetical protein ACM26V_20490 [Salipaludibacillus sp. HK11]|uniref:hypothetical protein n=1 Tax=Salipaludibacillus sp. HK11 TaxID=3394320 RepID=UPI0039FB93D7
MDAELLYGQYEGAEKFMLNYSKGEAGNYGEEINIHGEKLRIDENEFGHYLVFEVDEGHYLFSYQGDTFSREDAIEKTEDFIESLT